MGIAIVDWMFNKSFSLLTVWIAGVVYVILSDIILYHYDTLDTWGDKFVLLAIDAVLLGYFLTKPHKKNAGVIQEEHHEVRSPFIFISVMVLIYIIYLYNLIPYAIQSFLRGGRSVEMMDENNMLFSTFLGGYHVFPLVIAFYIIRIRHKSVWKAVLISLPIFFIDFVSGTRFRMLFTIMPFLLVSTILRIDNVNIKRMISLAILIIFVMYGANYMLHTRRSGFGNYVESEETEIRHPHSDCFSVKVCKECSPEGTIGMMNILHNHLQYNEPTYGLSTGFIFYFWIPRSLWPNKPTMLNHWLPRKYMNVGEGHSTSSGFMGEPYADFGYFAFVVYFMMGVLLRKGNNILVKYDYGRANVYTSLYTSLLIPFVFFAVRSPVTGTCYTLMQWLMLYLFSKFFVARKTNKL